MPKIQVGRGKMTVVNERERRAVARIASVRQYREMTQQQLADQVGMRRAAVSAVECGDRNLRLGEAAAICDALGVDLGAVVSEQPLVLRQEVLKQFE